MRILVAVDGSNYAYHAVQALAQLARAEQVALVHVVDVPVPAYPTMMPEVAGDLYARAKTSMAEQGNDVLRQMQAALPLDTGPCQARIEFGHPADVLLAIAQDTGSHLIVMGSRGLSPVKELLLGSVSHRVVAHAPCSILTINGPLHSIRHVLLAVEERKDADKALSFLAATPFRTRPKVTCLTVLPFSPLPWPAGAVMSKETERILVDQGRQFVEDVARRLGEQGYLAVAKTAVGAPSAVILDEARKAAPELLIVGTKGRQGVARFVLGSVSHTLLHQTPCPVVVVR
ncbi:hypothetical protein YTPLAS18_35670 [Nitrospira sp.]|nr:hypothetical protein YTPLAS18_35670 [Nitrospira sp.]